MSIDAAELTQQKGPGDRPRYVVNTTWLMAEKVLRMAVSLLVGVYVARYLGPERFGLLSYALSFVALFSFLATLGLETVLIRDLVKRPEEGERLLGSAFALKVTGSLLTVAVVSLIVQGTSSDRLTKVLVIIIASGMLFQSLQVIDFSFQSRVLARFGALAQIISFFSASALKVVLVAMKAPLVWFAWAYVVETALLGLCLAVFYRRGGGALSRWKGDARTMMGLLRDSWPLTLSGMVIMVTMRIDQVMIKEMLDSEALGIYSAAVTLSEAGYFIPAAVGASLFPAIVLARGKGEEEYQRRLQGLYDLLVWIALAIAIPVTLLSGDLVGWLFGGRYAAAGRVLGIHVWVSVFVFYGSVKGRWEVNENLQRVGLICTASGALCNVLMNLYMIPRYGAVGAAYATLMAQAVSGAIVPLMHRKNRQAVLCLARALVPMHRLKVMGRG